MVQNFESEADALAWHCTSTTHALYTNKIYGGLETLDAKEFARRRDFELLRVIVDLFRNEEFTSQEPDNLMLMHTSKSLELLEIDSVSELRRLIDGKFVEDYEPVFLDPNGEFHPRFARFIERSLAWKPGNQVVE